MAKQYGRTVCRNHRALLFPPFRLPRLAFGAIIGVVDLLDCVPVRQMQFDPWATGPVCWLLDNPRSLLNPVPWKGRLGLFEVPDDLLTRELAT